MWFTENNDGQQKLTQKSCRYVIHIYEQELICLLLSQKLVHDFVCLFIPVVDVASSLRHSQQVECLLNDENAFQSCRFERAPKQSAGFCIPRWHLLLPWARLENRKQRASGSEDRGRHLVPPAVATLRGALSQPGWSCEGYSNSLPENWQAPRCGTGLPRSPAPPTCHPSTSPAPPCFLCQGLLSCPGHLRFPTISAK